MRDLLEDLPTAPNYPSWWLDAIKTSKAVSDALSACQTPSEVDACAKEHRETYLKLDGNPATKIFAIHIKNLADVMRGPKPEPRKKLFPGLNDQALEAAGREWEAMEPTMRNSEDEIERMAYYRYRKHMADPEWSPSQKQAAHMKRIHMGWQVVEQGVVE